MRRTATPHKNVTPFILDNPVGIDTIVKSLQASLSNLTWLEKSFNRATIMSRINSNGDEEVYPICWTADGKDETKMIGNDNWTAYSFFVARETEEPVDYEQFDSINYERELSLYVWMNLERVDPAKTYDYIEELKQQIIVTVRNTTFENDETLEIESIEDDPLEIFNGFTVSPTDTQLLYYPYKGLRFDLNCTYSDTLDCITPTPPSIDPDAQAWVARMTAPTQLEIDSINTYVIAQKAAGNWDLIDEFFCFCFGPINSLVGAKVKTATANGGVTFPNVNGALLDGTNSYIDTNYNPTLDGVNYQLNDAMVSIFNKQYTGPPDGIKVVSGATHTTGLGFLVFNAIDLRVGVNSSNARSTIPDYGSDEMLSFVRKNSTNIEVYLEGAIHDTLIEPSNFIPAYSIYVGAYNRFGSDTDHYPGIVSTFTAGAGIGVDQSAHRTNVRNLLINLGQTLP